MKALNGRRVPSYLGVILDGSGEILGSESFVALLLQSICVCHDGMVMWMWVWMCVWISRVDKYEGNGNRPSVSTAQDLDSLSIAFSAAGPSGPPARAPGLHDS